MGAFADFVAKQSGGSGALAEGTVSDGKQGYMSGGRYMIPNQGNVWSNGQWRTPNEAASNSLGLVQTQNEAALAPVKLATAQAELGAKQSYQKVADVAGNKLSTLLSDPSSIESQPGYRFAYDQGMDAVNRTAAAKGMLGSGNRIYDLMQYGQGMAGKQYQNTLSGLGNFLNRNTMGTVQENVSGTMPTAGATTRSIGNSVAVNPYIGGSY